jgi:hypothetical protein
MPPGKDDEETRLLLERLGLGEEATMISRRAALAGMTVEEWVRAAVRHALSR